MILFVFETPTSGYFENKQGSSSDAYVKAL
jgi:hypothetical protein